MNYRKIYADIIRRAKERPKPNCYTERHHIVPKSLGGSNEKDNIVILTAREHFICHWLLVKIYAKGTTERGKMVYAFFTMRINPSKENGRYVSSRVYEKYKIEYHKIVKEERLPFAQERWDMFHSGNWKSLSDFDKAEGRSPMASRMMFTKMIPIYKSQSKTKYRRFRSDKSLIGKYE